MKNIIFDIDLTLVDTSCIEEARKNRNWQLAYMLIPKTIMYEGIQEVLETIRKYNIKCSIVSTSPRTYVERLVQYYQMPIKYIVGYHDAHPIKPHPAPMLKALEIMDVNASDTISFGDREIDIVASNAAKIESVACFWGTKEKDKLLNSGYAHAINKPIEILKLI
jgi:phosphoglycolate phosphatase-like HAD superfamily hydrolase